MEPLKSNFGSQVVEKQLSLNISKCKSLGLSWWALDPCWSIPSIFQQALVPIRFHLCPVMFPWPSGTFVSWDTPRPCVNIWLLVSLLHILNFSHYLKKLFGQSCTAAGYVCQMLIETRLFAQSQHATLFLPNHCSDFLFSLDSIIVHLEFIFHTTDIFKSLN